MVTGRQSEDKKYRKPIYSFSEEYLEQAYSVILDSVSILYRLDTYAIRINEFKLCLFISLTPSALKNSQYFL